MNPTDPRIHEILDQHGQGVRVSVPDLADRAIALERTHRRRRVGAGVVAGALALAVAVPFGLNVLGSRPAPVPAGPTPSVSTTVPTGASSRSSGPTTPATVPTIRTTGAPTAGRLAPATGPATGSTEAGYVVDGVYHEGDLTITLPARLHNPQTVARLGRGVVVVPTNGGDYSVVDAQGRQGRSIPAISPVAFGNSRSSVAALDRNEDLVAYDATGTEVARLAAAQCQCITAESHGSWQPVGIVGSLVYANRGHNKGHVVWDTATREVTKGAGTIALFNEQQQLALVEVPGDIAGDGDKVCRELVDLKAGTTRWRLCGALHLTRFSTDGDYLIGTGLQDGINPDITTGRFEALVVVRATDAEIVLLGGGDGQQEPLLGSAVMGADDVLTVSVTRGGAQGLQTCTLNGVCQGVTEAKPPVEASGDAAPPYRLSEN